MTTTQPTRRRTRRTRPPVIDAALLATLPDTWRPTAPEHRATMPGFCERCDHLARVPLGPGPGLCWPCRRAEELDRTPAPARPARPVQRRALGRSRR